MDQRFQKLVTRYRALFHAAKYGICLATGFLVTEAILTGGIFAVYHSVSVSSTNSLSPTLLELNALAFGIGVTVSFFLNERFTMRDNFDRRPGARNTLIRLVKFQLVSLAGNLVTVGVQLLLLGVFSVPPTFGNIVGAIVAFPVSYFVSMRIVWKISGLSPPRAVGK